jgi:hypothetical protein
MATAYGAGFIAGRHCDLGQLMFHGGGYPGYGSFLLLLPDHGIGIFAFANRTYAGPIAPVFGTAQVLQKAGLLNGRTLPVTPALAETYRAARAMWQAGRVQPGRHRLAMNFLMDRSAENWAREFARLKGETGTCRTDAPITATGALAGRFTWTCQKADLAGDLLLAPTNMPGIQALRFTVQPSVVAHDGDLACDSPDPVPGDVPRPARHQPGWAGACGRNLVARSGPDP